MYRSEEKDLFIFILSPSTLVSYPRLPNILVFYSRILLSTSFHGSRTATLGMHNSSTKRFYVCVYACMHPY
jgi:hypothetical protein